MKRLLDGALLGAGFVVVVAVAFAIAWAGDVFIIDKDGTVKFAVSDAGKITVGATESYVNLVIQNDEVVAESDNKLDITADVLTVEGIRLENVAVSANIESAGAGGLDTGSELADRWYYVWVITNNNGTSVNGILTLAPLTPNPPTSPVLHSGFTKKRRVGAVRNYGNNFLSFVQEGRKINYMGYQEILAAGTSLLPTYTIVSAASHIPPTSQRGAFILQSYVNHNATGVSLSSYMRKSGTSSAQAVASLLTVVAGLTHVAGKDVECDLNSIQNIEYAIGAVPSGSGGTYIYVLGYYDRI